jgi:NAD(P)-dependent dehydrogenase (short-subunit alcohol dehydrogenase family)
MAVELAGKVAAITGGAQGIGRAIAAALVAEGMSVAIGDLDLPAALATAEALGPRVRAFDLDVTSPASVDDFVAAAEAALGPLDVFVNNAGIMLVGELAKEDDRATDLQIDVNLRGVLNGCKAAVRVMADRGDGHIVNIASTAGKVAVPRLVTYTATKHAVVGATDSLRAELRPLGIQVSAIMPVPVNTRLGAELGRSMVPPVEVEDVARQVVRVLRRRSNEAFVPSYVELISACVRWLPSPARDWVTRALGGHDVMLQADDAGREAYQREALDAQRGPVPR